MPIVLFTINPGLEIVGDISAWPTYTAFVQVLRTVGGMPPYSISASELPGYLSSVDSGDGSLTISGAVPVAGVYSVVVIAQDATGKRVRKTYRLRFFDEASDGNYIEYVSGGYILYQDGTRMEYVE